MLKRAISFLCVASLTFCLVFFAPAAHADSIAVHFTNTTGDSLDNPPFTLGWEFTANVDITVTSLGLFDSSQDGLLDSHPIGLWDNSGNLLVSAVVASGTTATLLDKFRFVSITPTDLLAGESYRIGTLYSTSVSDGLIFPGEAMNFLTNASITFVQDRFFSGASLSFPTQSLETGPGFFGPNFLFTPTAIPAPATLALLLSGGIMGRYLLGRRRTK